MAAGSTILLSKEWRLSGTKKRDCIIAICAALRMELEDERHSGTVPDAFSDAARRHKNKTEYRYRRRRRMILLEQWQKKRDRDMSL